MDALIASLNANGIAPVADVVYNHRDGGAAEDNPAVKAYIETHFNGNGKQPFPSDRYRNRLPLGGAYGAGDYFIKLSSKTESYGANQYKFYATVASMDKPFVGSTNENEPNGGGDCGQPFNTILLDQDMVGTLFDFSGCYTDEFKLTIAATDYDPAGDDLIITMTNVSGGYSDHRIYDIYYAPANGSPGFNIPLADLRYQTFTDFTGLPSGQGGMNFENFRPNSANTSTTFMAGEPIQNDAVLGYAYLLTNNQLGLPTVFYPDFAGTTIPNAPVFDLSAEITELIDIHKSHIFGASTVEYLNQFDTPRAANYQMSNAGEALIYQLSGGPGIGEVVVAINFGDGTLKVDQEVAVPASRSADGLSFIEMTGNAFNTTTMTDGSNRILIDVPRKSYAVYVATSVLPVELADFQATLDDKGRVDLRWETLTEEALNFFTVEASAHGTDFMDVAHVAPKHTASLYQLTDDRPWTSTSRYYRLKTLSADGSAQRSVVRRVNFTAQKTLTASPNPAQDEVLIMGIPAESSWVMMTAAGREVQVKGRRSASGLKLNLRALTPGLYWFRSGGEMIKVVVR